MNFTKDVKEAIMNTWMKTTVLLEMESTETSAIITNVTRQAIVSGYKTVDPTTVRNLGTATSTIGTIATATIGVAGVFAAFSICFSMGFLAGFLNFF